MSKQIDPQKIADGTLDEDEVRYLQDRNLLPASYQGAAESSAPEDEEPEDEEETEEEETDETETYEEGWNNDSRRAELSKRGLDIDGSKAELIARLIEDDQK